MSALESGGHSYRSWYLIVRRIRNLSFMSARGIRKCSFDHVPDLLPDAPIELNQSHLLDRSEIIRTRVDLDAGQ
jgi:hypothetical protein